jgi:hypothetical protein
LRHDGAEQTARRGWRKARNWGISDNWYAILAAGPTGFFTNQKDRLAVVNRVDKDDMADFRYT